MLRSKVIDLLIFLLFFISQSDVFSQEELELLNTKVYWGESNDIAISGYRVFIANGSGGLRTIDISDDQNPIELDPLSDYKSEVVSVEVFDTTLFVLSKNSYSHNQGLLSIYNISESGELTETGQLSLDCRVNDLEINNDMGIVNNLLIVDLSDISNPFIAGELVGDESCYNRDIKFIDQNTVILNEVSSDHFGYIKFYDISNPENPILISSQLVGENSDLNTIFLNNQYAYIANNDFLKVYDITDNENIVLLDSLYFTPDNNEVIFKDICFLNNDISIVLTHYISSRRSKVTILDNSDIDDISVISTTEVENYTIGMESSNNKLFFANTKKGMNVYEIQDQSVLNRLYGVGYKIQLNTIIPVSGGFAGYYDDAYSDYSSVIYTLDTEDQINPRPLGILEINKDLLSEPFYYNDCLYICNRENGVSVFNISDFSNPFILDSILTSKTVRAIKIIDDYIFYTTTQTQENVHIAELNSPDEVVTTIEGYKTIAFNGEYLILGGSDRISTFDISEIESPQELGTVNAPCLWIDKISVTENMVYAILIHNGYYYSSVFVDISDPDSPFISHASGGDPIIYLSYAYGIENYLVSRVSIPDDPQGYDYITNIFDYSGSSSPEHVGYFNHGEYGENFIPDDVIWMNGYLYGYEDNIIQVYDFPFELDVDDENIENYPTEYSIASAYPNPFNPTINIGINLSHPGDLQVKVYNINGQLVEILTDGYFSSGNHHLMFDGSNYSSGVYFINALVPNEMNQTIKITLVK